MSDGNEFQRSDAVTGNVRRLTVVSLNDGMSSWFDDAELLTEVSDVWAGWRHEPVDSGMKRPYKNLNKLSYLKVTVCHY